MVKIFKLTMDDLRILKRRIADPCSGCPHGPSGPTDYGWLGCGEADCPKKAAYNSFWKDAKKADINDLATKMLALDSYHRQKQKLDEKILKIHGEIRDDWGSDVLTSVVLNFYS